MNSFYGGLTGQHFKFSAIFPSRVALADDLKQTSYSPIGLDEFVLISYGLQNIIKDGSNATAPFNDYDGNRVADQNKYNNRTFNSTLWQKIYREDLKYDTTAGIFWYKNATYTIADIEENYINGEVQEKGFCYICLGTFTGTTPLITVQTNNIAPAEIPSVEINNNEIDKPVITFNLPEAVEIFWDIEIENEKDGKPVLVEGIPQLKNNIEYPDTIKAGDYIVSKYDYIYLYNKEENETPILEYKGTFIPTFKQVNNNLNTFNDNGDPNQITIELKYNSHNDYTFETKVPRIPEIMVEVTELPVVGTEMEPKMAEPSILTTKNENTLHFNFGIPQAISMKHKWNGTKLVLTSASKTTETELGTDYKWNNTELVITAPNGNVIKQDLKGDKGDTATPENKYWVSVKATSSDNDYQQDILKAVQDYIIDNQELIYVVYTTYEDIEQGYIVINPSGVEGYKIVPTSGGSGSGAWEELE